MSNNKGVTLQDLYQALEPYLERTIAREARSFHRVLGMPQADAAQEARIALYQALPAYDYDRSRGGIHRFAQRTIRNALCGLMYAAIAQMRAPHVVITDGEGNDRLVRLDVEALEDMALFEPADEGSSPETRAIESQMDERIQLLRLRLLMSLSGRERQVFECQAMPSEAFLIWMRNEGHEEPTIEAIGKFLGMSKNMMDWSVHKIKHVFTHILEESEYSDLIEGAIREGKWPMVYMSARVNDIEFIRAMFESQTLDSLPRAPRDDLRSGKALRVIEWYQWGSIVHLKMDEERQRTLLLIGRFNPRTGEIIGPAGHWKQLNDYVPWYSDLCKALTPARKRDN